MHLHISRGRALACVLLITFMFAGCTQGVKEYWKTSKRYYYEYINTPAKVDLELEEELPAGVAVVPFDRFHDVRERHVVLQHGGGIETNLILQDVTADREDVCDAGNGPQLELHLPVVQFAQVGIGFFSFGIGGIVDGQVIHEDLSETR